MKLTTLAIVLSLPTPALAQSTVTFEDRALPPGTFFNGGPVTSKAGFTSAGTYFTNSYDSRFGGFWSGFSLSNVNAPTTPGFSNQYASVAGPGPALSPSDSGTYAVYYASASAFINLPAGQRPVSVDLTNTAYAYYSMLNGDPFSKKFGGPTGLDPDFLKLTLTGYALPDAAGPTTGTLDFYLADFRPDGTQNDYILNTWTRLDLTPLAAAASLKLSFTSSDTGAFGINTPTYVALDNLSVPEPATAALALPTLLLGRRRRPGTAA